MTERFLSAPLFPDGFLFGVAALSVLSVDADAIASFRDPFRGFAHGWSREPDSAGSHIDSLSQSRLDTKYHFVLSCRRFQIQPTLSIKRLVGAL